MLRACYVVGRRPRSTRPIEIEGDVAHIRLTRGFVATIDAVDVPLVSGWRWHATTSASGHFYAARKVRIDGRDSLVMLHRTLMNAPEDELVDHRDGDGLNNRRLNLRLATHTQNMQNRKVHQNNTTGHTGVYRHKGAFIARITQDGRTINLGRFPTIEEAIKARQAAERELQRETRAA